MTDVALPQPTDDALREHMLTDDELCYCEAQYPGYVRIYASGRYHARIRVGKAVWNFSIKQLPHGERELVADYPEDVPARLLELAWHRAAEAMLAHRRGHLEASKRRELRKPQRQEA